MDKYVEQAKSKGGSDAQVHEVYDAHYGEYHDPVCDHMVKEPAAKPKDAGVPSPLKIGGK